MSTVKCPKCSYKRQPSDTAPDWQCPSCGIAYAKFGSEAPVRKTATKVAEADDGIGNRLLYALLGGGGGAIMGGIFWFLTWAETAGEGGTDLKIQHAVIGGAILDAVLRVWPAERIRVADRGLREGVLMRLMAQHRP